MHEAGPGNIRIADYGLHTPFYPVHAHSRTYRALDGVIVRPGALRADLVPIPGSRTGPGAVPHVVAGTVVQAAVAVIAAQVQRNVVDHGGGVAVDLVPCEAGRGRGVEAVVGVVVIMIHGLQSAH